MQVARLLHALPDPSRILSIQVDAVYVDVPKAEVKNEKKFQSATTKSIATYTLFDPFDLLATLPKLPD